MRIYLANVGVNTGHKQKWGLVSPLFDDDNFEFLPIPGSKESNWYYHHLKSPKGGGSLLRYIPKGFHNAACHNSPEFKAMTYGEVYSPRGSNLQYMECDDVLLFIAHLWRWRDGKPVTEEHGFYLVGGLRVEQCVKAGKRLQGVDAENFRNLKDLGSAEADRFKNLKTLVNDMLFAGDKRSRRFHKAVPITRKICDQVLRDATGQPYDWAKQGGNEIRIIGSYTRTCRCVLDTSIPQQARRAATLRKWIARHSGEYDAELLAE